MSEMKRGPANFLFILAIFFFATEVTGEEKEIFLIWKTWGITKIFGDYDVPDDSSITGTPTIELTVETVPFSKNFELRNKKQTGNRWWGGKPTEFFLVLKKISLVIKNKKVAIPENAYADLLFVPDQTQTPNLQLFKDRENFVFKISGSDAGDAYTATFTICDGKLLTRKVILREMPNLIFEISNFNSLAEKKETPSRPNPRGGGNN